jgi:taurine dioxygenase
LASWFRRSTFADRREDQMGQEKVSATRIAGACGAEIEGVDLSRPLDAATVAAIRSAILDHQVIFFRGQQAMDDAALERFTACFGEFGLEPFVEGEATSPHCIAVIKEADERRKANFGGAWHTDWSFQERPPAFTLLHARQLPPYGGDTMFASQYLACEALSPTLRGMLEGLSAVHSARRSYGPQGTYSDPKQARSMKIRTGEDALAEMVHPVIRVHGESGRKALYVNPIYTLRFDGWSARESEAMLAYLTTLAIRPEFTCRFRWSEGALAMWDNRCVQHLALNDYDGFRREMRRTTVRGERPLGVADRPHMERQAAE